MFFQLACHLKSHFDGLQDDIKSTDRSLKSFVKLHVQILKTVSEINDLFLPIIFTQCVLTAINVCVISVQIMDNFEINARLLGNVGFLLAVLLQWFIYCHGGEYVATGVKFLVGTKFVLLNCSFISE